MAEFLSATSAVIVLLMMLMVGYALGHVGWAGTSEKKFLGKYILTVALPAGCIDGLLTGLERDELEEVFYLVLVTFINVVITYTICAIIGKGLKLPHNRYGVFVPTAAAANSLLVGLPLCLQLFGDESLPYATAYYMGTTTVTQSAGLMFVKNSGTKNEGKPSAIAMIKSMLSSPPIIALLVALFMLAFNLQLPSVVMSMANYFGRSVTSLAMVYSGLILYEVGLKNLKFHQGLPTAMVLRLLISPIICWTVTGLFGVDGMARDVLIVASAMPSVTQVTVTAGVYGADDKYAATGAGLTLLGSFITIPLLKALIQYI